MGQLIHREMSLRNISTNVIELWNGRDLIEFKSTGGGVYTDDNDLSLTTTENGNYSNCIEFYRH